LTSYAGGHDDGAKFNGQLLTVGDYYDSNANPLDPNGNDPEDELYTLIPFLSVGDTFITVRTVNPSNDDNIFLAAIFSTIPSSALRSCGDGILDPNEECDDGNTVANDGCSAICTLECGDGILDPNEECDDGNTVANDGCSPICTLECTGTDQLTVEKATASSVEWDKSHYAARNAVDGLQNSRWASKGPAAEGASEEQWIRFDLGGIRYIDSMLLEWERAYSREYIIKVSIDGISWTVERTFIDGNGGQVQVNQLDVFARYVQISSRLGDRNYGISLYEVTIYGKDCTIPPPPKCGETILGLDAAIASASSMEGSNWSPDKAIDGDFQSRWSSAFTDDEWLAVDLGAPTLIYAVWVHWEDAFAEDYDLQVADSLSGPWRTVVEMRDSDGHVDILDGLEELTQYFRVLCLERARDNYGNSIWELEVHGTQDPICLDPLGD
jgi:cysteine-rich repeat protein